jgi:hypothetical protein
VLFACIYELDSLPTVVREHVLPIVEGGHRRLPNLDGRPALDRR